MKTGGGDFSPEAYEQLREAYDKEQQRTVDDELAGTKLMGQEYGLETLPVDSPWKDKIENWNYPSGRGQYLDEHQSPDEILKVMREAAQERIDAKNEEVEEEETEEEVEATAEEETEEEETVAESEEEEKEEEEAEEPVAETEEEEAEEPAAEAEEAEEAEEEEEEEENEEEEYDPDEVAAQISQLRAELENLRFITGDQPEEDDES